MFKKLLVLMLVLASLSVTACVPAFIEPLIEKQPEEVYVPPLSENAREVVSLGSIVYERPDTESILAEASAITEGIDKKNLSYEEICEKISALDERYNSFSTMLTYMMIKNSHDSSDETAATEYEHLSSVAPSLTKAFEDLFVSAARSEYAKRLEEEIFWEGFVEEYADGTIYNDLIVSLLKEEAEIEARYTSLSTSNVKITYGGKTDTYDNITAELKERYHKNSPLLNKAINECDALFDEAMQKESSRAFTDLLKVRRRIADALGYESYSEYAYDIFGHGYTESELNALITDVSEFIIPVYYSLSSNVFAGYFKTHFPISLDRGRVINHVYKALVDIDKDIAEAYAYMLNSELYDVEGGQSNRLAGAFTTYLYQIEAPFIFATLNGDGNDYMTLAHEFGHFYDAYVNQNSDASLDLLEVSSTALELLVLGAIDSSISEREYKYLYYSEMESVLQTLIFQSFYARFESLAYSLKSEEITEENLNAIVKDAADDLYLNREYFNGLEDIMIYHLVMEPFYVQSYCTSTLSSLDIFFMESENPGAGLGAYSLLIEREGEDFTEELSRAGLKSPFRRNGVKDIADKIYFSIIGSYYFVTSQDNNAA